MSAFLYRSVGWRDVYNSLLTSARITDLDRHADRRRAGLQLRDHGREHPEDAQRALLKALRALAARCSCCSANILLLILGCFLEGTTILLVIVPVLLPTAQALGIDPVHFGVVVRGQHHDRPGARRPTACCSS